ncbi:Factor VIII intron 22 protein, partial [Nibea albiflora]
LTFMFSPLTELSLESTVFVAFADKGLNIQCALKIPANYSQDSLMCYDVSDREICKLDTPSTGNQGTTFKPKLELKNLTSSGEYYCRYKAVRVYWFLRVIHGYKHVEVSDYMFISVSVLTSMLLVFSVVGSVYVFRGHWKESTSDPGNTDRKRKNSRQERKQSEEKEDNMNVTSSSSFYASLEPRPRSIYDVLDRSAVTTEPHQGKAKPKKEPQKTLYFLVLFVVFVSIMAAEGDFLARYRAVSNKLKKRFLRKPNVAEASEQFGQLAKELKQQDCLQYAAFCNLAMARCEQTLFNAPGEALALTDAARLFLSSEKENRALQAPGFDEHLQAALNCYSFAIKVYIEMNQPVMAASLCLELGNALKEMNRPGEAIVHYQRAAELQTQTPVEALLSMGEMATCKILTRDYDGALSVFTEMQLMCQERGLQLPGHQHPCWYDTFTLLTDKHQARSPTTDTAAANITD